MCLRDFSVLFWRVLVCPKLVFSDGQDVKYVIVGALVTWAIYTQGQLLL